MKRADAYAKLVEHCDALAYEANGHHPTPYTNARTRRFIRALLEERAGQARVAYWANSSRPHPSEADTVKAAVLRRPARPKKARGK